MDSKTKRRLFLLKKLRSRFEHKPHKESVPLHKSRCSRFRFHLQSERRTTYSRVVHKPVKSRADISTQLWRTSICNAETACENMFLVHINFYSGALLVWKWNACHGSSSSSETEPHAPQLVRMLGRTPTALMLTPFWLKNENEVLCHLLTTTVILNEGVAHAVAVLTAGFSTSNGFLDSLASRLTLNFKCFLCLMTEPSETLFQRVRGNNSSLEDRGRRPAQEATTLTTSKELTCSYLFLERCENLLVSL